VIDTELCRIGVAICYDIRFPELLRLMALKGAEVIAVPAAFNMTTGPVHWAHTIHARAVDNQVYMAAVSPARDCNASYVAYGNSMLVDPWGKEVACIDEREALITGEIDIDLLVRIREQLPLLKHRREDIYSLEYRH
jgi:predicted amidohydrolase